MPDKRDMHQAKSHRNSKTKGQAAGGKARGQASVPGGSGATIAMQDTQAMPVTSGQPTGKKNKSRR
jgi:hypothetical protein